MKIHWILFLSLDYDINFLPHLVKHYGKYIDTGYFVLHKAKKETDKSKERYAINLLHSTWNDSDIRLWYGFYSDRERIVIANRYISYLPPDDMIFMCDSDEFFTFPFLIPILAKKIINNEQNNVVRCRMIDRWADPTNRKVLPPVDPSISLSEQFPYYFKLCKNDELKDCLYRVEDHGDRVIYAIHYVSYSNSPILILSYLLDHYKWTSVRPMKLHQWIHECYLVPNVSKEHQDYIADYFKNMLKEIT